MTNNKSPGPDGIPVDVLKIFVDELAPILTLVFNATYDIGLLPIVMRQGNIVLLFKNKGSRSDPTSYRPIGLCSKLYACLSTVLTLWLDKVLHGIIYSNQTGFVRNRFMHENIIRLMDLMSHVQDANTPACIISTDLYHCFDCISREVLLKVLDIVCGETNHSFTRWIKLLLRDQERRILVNGKLTAAFTLRGGTTQGDPISPLLCTIIGESLGRLLHKNVQGIKIPGTADHASIARYCDDYNAILPPWEVGTYIN